MFRRSLLLMASGGGVRKAMFSGTFSGDPPLTGDFVVLFEDLPVCVAVAGERGVAGGGLSLLSP
jgi:hypothetical protein